MQQLKLIQLYFYVCEIYEEELQWHCERLTKNQAEPTFSDCELLTTYLFAVGDQQRFQVKQIHRYIEEHWLDWFPALPSYQSYNARLNRLVATFPVLLQRLICELAASQSFCQWVSLTDSMPIKTCSNRRKAKVALSLCNKGYNAVKKCHYYGVKLHHIAFWNPGTLPVPEYLFLTPASVHDLTAQQTILESFEQRVIVGDKAFASRKLNRSIRQNQGELLTPIVYQDDIQRALRSRTQRVDELYSAVISSVRQPIESFFNWLIEKTDIQRASKVRSQKGLLVHIFGKMAAAFLSVIIDAKLCP